MWPVHGMTKVFRKKDLSQEEQFGQLIKSELPSYMI